MVPRQITSALITGGTGYIGSILTDYLARHVGLERVDSLGSAELDVTDRAAVAERMAGLCPEAVFHLAAKAETDWCEDHYAEARRVNVEGAVNVVEEALAAGARVAYFSSACLYPDNARPYAEGDELAALCRYTETKREAEQRLRPHAARILTVRMRQPFSNHRHPRNLLRKLASYSRFIDEPNAMSHLEECLPVVWQLLLRGSTGPYNITNEGWTTPLRIARMIKEHCQPEMSVEPIGYNELLSGLRAHRVNALVDCAKLAAEGFRLRPVEEAVRDCLIHPCDPGQYDWTRSEP